MYLLKLLGYQILLQLQLECIILLHFETMELVPMEFESGLAYWQYSRSFSAVASVLAQVPADQHEPISDEVWGSAAKGDRNGVVRLTSQLVIASGVR